MSKGYFNEDGLWVTAYKQHQEELLIDDMLLKLKDGYRILDQPHRELLIQNGYDPDTGEYNED